MIDLSDGDRILSVEEQCQLLVEMVTFVKVEKRLKDMDNGK